STILAFPNGRHDDQVVSMTQTLNEDDSSRDREFMEKLISDDALRQRCGSQPHWPDRCPSAAAKGMFPSRRSPSPVSGPTFVDATEGGKRLRRGARLWTVAVSTFKTETYRFLRLERPTTEERDEGAAFPPGTIQDRKSVV